MSLPPKYRKIIHVDMDAFFASIEQRDFSEYRGRPLVVGGSAKRGVVAAASYEARKFGIHSAMPSSRAASLCKDLIFVKGRYEVYSSTSKQIMEIFNRYTDLVEAMSLDEAYLDVTENNLNEPLALEIAKQIQNDIWNETQLTASAGVSYNKFLAKIASDLNKPNGIKVIHPTQAVEILSKLPIHKFYGIGKVTADKLRQRNINLGADLQNLDLIHMEALFGKNGYFFHQICQGIDNRPVKSIHGIKSVGAERTFFDDLVSESEIKEIIKNIALKISERLLKKELSGKNITLKVRFSDFSTFSRSKMLDNEISSEIEIQFFALELFNLFWDKQTPIRLIGISISHLTNTDFLQTQLSFDL